MDRWVNGMFALFLALPLAPGAACSSSPQLKDRAAAATPPAAPSGVQRVDYARRIDHFADGTPPAKIKAAVDALEAAGVDAFPTLIAHFDDPRLADEQLWGAIAGTKTVGYVCFEVLQGQIEGDWSKAWRHLRVQPRRTPPPGSTPGRGWTLADLRRGAALDGLHNVNAALAANPSNKGLRAFADTLRRRAADRS